MTAENLAAVNRYYDELQSTYNNFWMKKTLAMHVGFWDHDTKNFEASLLNENRYVVDALDLNDGDIVLDAGCGVGGTAIYLAERRDVRVHGISINENQIDLADEHRAARNVEDRTTFSAQNYLATDFADESFDSAYAIESMCHAHSKREFLAEMWRVLKPGGRLVIIDEFRADRVLDSRERRLLDDWLTGWAVPNMLTRAEFDAEMADTGFSLTRDANVTDKVMKSASIIRRVGMAFFLFDYVLSMGGRGGLVSATEYRSTVAALRQLPLFTEEITTFHLLVCTKPEPDGQVKGARHGTGRTRGRT